ncbi:MAG: hypothetical protein WDA59_05460 [Methanofastidiosum sp.]
MWATSDRKYQWFIWHFLDEGTYLGKGTKVFATLYLPGGELTGEVWYDEIQAYGERIDTL